MNRNTLTQSKDASRTDNGKVFKAGNTAGMIIEFAAALLLKQLAPMIVLNPFVINDKKSVAAKRRQNLNNDLRREASIKSILCLPTGFVGFNRKNHKSGLDCFNSFQTLNPAGRRYLLEYIFYCICAFGQDYNYERKVLIGMPKMPKLLNNKNGFPRFPLTDADFVNAPISGSSSGSSSTMTQTLNLEYERIKSLDVFQREHCRDFEMFKGIKLIAKKLGNEFKNTVLFIGDNMLGTENGFFEDPLYPSGNVKMDFLDGCKFNLAYIYVISFTFLKRNFDVLKSHPLITDLKKNDIVIISLGGGVLTHQSYFESRSRKLVNEGSNVFTTKEYCANKRPYWYRDSVIEWGVKNNPVKRRKDLD